MRTKFFGLMVAITASLLLLGCPNPTTPSSDTVINIVAITGITAPVFGATPVTTITETAQYTGTVAWSGTPKTFASATAYTATITLTANAGYTLTGVVANSFTVAGATATNPVNSGVVTAVFPETGDGSYTSTNIGTLKYVPAGTFQRGETVTHTFTVSAFRMSQYEINRAQFLAIMGTDPVVDGGKTAYSSGTTDPVMYANWYHAIAFCNKLSIAEGLTPVYAVSGVNFNTLNYAAIPTYSDDIWNDITATWTNNGYRLPTEMEWMWAAMGAPADGQSGGTNTTGYLKGYAGSTEGSGQTNIGNYAWHHVNSGNKTRSVGTKIANELGLFDMSGNVWEWNWDWYGPYPPGPRTDYRGTASGSYRVAHGGSWDGAASSCKVALQGMWDPESQSRLLGFRVVRP